MLEVIPCSPGGNIGEQITRDFLKQRLTDGVLLTNYYHPEGAGTLELDLVLINSRCVWLIEVKHWWGKIVGDEINWWHGDRKYNSPISSIDHKVKVIHSDLLKLGINNLSVVGVVVLSKGTQTLKITDPRRDRVFGLNDNLIQALTTSQKVYSPHSPVLSAHQVNQVKEALIHRHVYQFRKIVGSYRIVGELAPGENYLAYEGQHVEVQTRRARIKCYKIEAIQSREHLQESIRRFKRDMEALSQLADRPHIVQAYDFFPDPIADDTYWLILELVDGITLRDALDENRSLTLSEQMDWLIPVADALATCHQRGICHRNLTPRAVYRKMDGVVKVGDFDFARIPALGFTISKTDHPLVLNKYIAPEQQTNPRIADQRADLYSLGALWYDLIFHPPANEPIFYYNLNRLSLPIEARQLLQQLLSGHPAERPACAEDVKEWFELFKS